jgi:hypothetical protein
VPSRGLGVATLRSRLGALISLVNVELGQILPFVPIGWSIGSLALPKIRAFARYRTSSALPVLAPESRLSSPYA